MPEFDFRTLEIPQDLISLARTSEGIAGYTPFQVAADLLRLQRISRKDYQVAIKDPQLMVRNLTDEDYGKMKQVLGK